MAVLHRGKGKRQVEGKPSGGRLRSDIVRRKLYSSERSKEGETIENEAIIQLRELISRAKSFGQLSTLLLAYLHEKFNETVNSWLICQLQTIAFDLDLSMNQIRDIIEIFDALQVVEFTETSIIYRHAPRCNLFFHHLYEWVQGYLENTSENIVEAYVNAHDRSCVSMNGKLTIQLLLILFSSHEFQHLDEIVSQLVIDEEDGVTMRERTRRISNIAAALAQNGAVTIDGKRLKFNYEIVQSEEYPCFDPIPSDILYVAANDAQVYRTRRHGGSLQLNQINRVPAPPAKKQPFVNFDLLESPMYVSQCDVVEILNSSECAKKANAPGNEVPDVICHEIFTPSPLMSFPKVKYEELEDFDEWIDGQGMFSSSAWTMDALLNDQVEIFHV